MPPKPKPTPKKGNANTAGDDDVHAIMEGVASIHSWIKAQTMIRCKNIG
jgi:hypothetical protein